MQYNKLGRTGIDISAIGLGASGPSRLGLSNGGTRPEAIRLVHGALDLGINLIDVSSGISGTDTVVAESIKGRRASAVLSIKLNLSPPIWPLLNSRFFHRLAAKYGATFSHVAAEPHLRRRFDGVLRVLGTDHIDILSLHAVTTGQYSAALEKCVPLLMRLKEEGKIRAFGLSEAFLSDPEHRVVQSAMKGRFDMLMAGFNIFNQSAETLVFSEAANRGVGTVAMFATRRWFKNESIFREGVDEWKKQPSSTEAPSADNILSVMRDCGVGTVAEMALRFCAFESQANSTLTGTGSLSHLQDNVEASEMGPLPDELLNILKRFHSDP